MEDRDSRLLDALVRSVSLETDDNWLNYPGDCRFTPHRTDEECLATLYDSISLRYPTLFEKLLLSYRWTNIDLGDLCLLPNPPGPDLSGFLEGVFADKAISKACLESGYLQFGFGAGGSYDPVCFRVVRGKSRRNFPVVLLDHEAILCRSTIQVSKTMAGSFEELVAGLIPEELS